MGQILAIVSSKGGVGKTTTAVNLSAAFASLDFPTLLVEADPQCCLVASFGFDRFEVPRGLSDVARGASRLEETTFETPVPALHVVSSNVWSQEEEASYLSAIERDPLLLRRALAPLKERYDYLVIDSPPMLGPITMAALVAADRFIVPVQTEPHAVRALSRLLEAVEQVRARYNPALKFDGVALTMVDSRTRMSLGISEQLRRDHPERVFSTPVPRSVRLAEIPNSGRPLVVAAPASRGARAYASLAEEILLMHARERMEERAAQVDLDAVGVIEPPDDMPPPEELATGVTLLSIDEVPVMGNGALGTAEAAPLGAEPSEAELGGLAAPADEEWDERFVDLDTYLEMESGEASKKTPTSEEEEWENTWGAWGRDD